MGKKKLISCTSSKLIVDNEEITDNSVFAEEFDNVFVDMGPNLASKIPVTNKHHSQFQCMFLSCHLRVSEWIHTIVAWMSRNSLLEAGAESEV